MVIQIPIKLCEHLKEISVYNCNYYKLPKEMKIDENDIICELCDEDYDSYEYILGNSKEGKFIDDCKHIRYPSSYGFNICSEFFIFESDRKNEYNT